MLQAVYNTKAAIQYKGYLELKDNALYIKSLVEIYTKKYKLTNFFKEPSPTKEHDVEDIASMNCMFLSIIILYGKLFKTADRRSIKLERRIFNKDDRKMIERHDLLMDVRDNFVAHAGITPLEYFNLTINYNNGLFISKESSKAFTGQCVEKENIDPLLDIILAYIENSIVKSKRKIDRELDLLGERLEMFHTKAMNNQPVDDRDIL